MKTVAIVQARIGSTRLPGKALLDLAGRPLIVLMLQRVKKSRTVDEIVLATGQGSQNDGLEAVVSNYGFSVFRGPEDDVLARYALTASRFGADRIVRLTGDCPLMDSKIVDRLVGVCIDGSYDYVTNVKPPSWPDGMDVSVFTREILQDACHYARKKSEREHVVPWMWRMTPLEGGCTYAAKNVESQENYSHIRLTVDEEIDYILMKKLVSEIGDEKILDAGLKDILHLLAKKPEISKINQGIIRDAGYFKDLIKEEGECV